MRRTLLVIGGAGVLLLLWRVPRLVELIVDGDWQDRIAALAAIAVVPAAWVAYRWSGGGQRFPLVNRASQVGVVLVVLLALAAALAPVLSVYDPTLSVGPRNAAPTWQHPLGTDFAGRDVLSRVLNGGRISLAIAIISIAMSISIGTAVGLVAALNPTVDGVLMRLVDTGLAFPRVFLLLILFSFWNRIEIPIIILILGGTGWFGTSRLVRAEALSVRARDFVTAARALGVGTWRVVVRHVLPNVYAPILVTAVLGAGNVILIESGLAFLGIGVQPPHPSWGRMIADGRDFLLIYPLMAFAPGFMITLTVLGFSLLGEGLRAALDPRHR